MRALTVQPGTPGSLRVEDIPDPETAPSELLVRGLAIGVYGTDKEIVRGDYGWSPATGQRLVLGHESLGRVEWAPPESSFGQGDLIVDVVHRPDPEPCGACRGRRVGHVPQRPLHQARHQGATRPSQRVVDDPRALRRRRRRRAGTRGGPDRAHHRGGEGMGALSSSPPLSNLGRSFPPAGG